MISFLRISLLVALAAFAVGSSAQAAPPGVDLRAEVHPLYEEALRLMGAKDYAAACVKLEEVVRRYPEGIGAWIELGRCEEARGRIVRAYEVYSAAAAGAANEGQTDRSRRAQEAAKALEPRLSRWTIVVPETARRLPGFAVRVDDAPLDAAKWDRPIPIEGGRHVVTVEAQGKRPWETTIEIAPERDAKHVIIGPLVDVDMPRPTAPVVTTSPSEKRSSTVRIVGYIAGGLGVANFVAGSIAGGIALSKHREAIGSHNCDERGCNDIGGALEEQSRVAGNVSTGTFIAGGVLVAAGAVMAFAIPGSSGEGAKVSIRPMGATVMWAF